MMLDDTIQESHAAWRQVNAQWQEARTEWRDKNARHFEANFWRLMTQETEDYQRALLELRETLQRAREVTNNAR